MTVQDDIAQAQELAEYAGEVLGSDSTLLESTIEHTKALALVSIAKSLAATAAMQYAQRAEDEINHDVKAARDLYRTTS